MAKTRKAPKSAVKKKKKTVLKKKKTVLNLKKLAQDIEKAQKVLRERQGRSAQKAGELTTTQSVLQRWAADIATLCADPSGEPCGPDMVITS